MSDFWLGFIVGGAFIGAVQFLLAQIIVRVILLRLYADRDCEDEG